MFRVLTLSQDGTITESTSEADVAPPPEGARRWVDLVRQDERSMAVLERAFHFHPLAIEDCLQDGQRAKLEEYDPYVFVVTHALRCKAGDDPGELEPQELHAFLDRAYLVTVHSSPIESLDAVWQRTRAEAATLGRGPDFPYYLVVDSITDKHFALLDRIHDQLESLEEAVLDHAHKEELGRIFQLKHTLAMMRRSLSPERDIFGILSRRGGDPRVSERNAVYFRDVYDHLVRINESIDSARDLLTSALDAYLSMVSQRTNDIMKSLTILSAVFLPLTFLTGFFGQNFDGLPMKSDALMWGVITACVLIPAGMMYWFLRRGWL